MTALSPSSIGDARHNASILGVHCFWRSGVASRRAGARIVGVQYPVIKGITTAATLTSVRAAIIHVRVRTVLVVRSALRLLCICCCAHAIGYFEASATWCRVLCLIHFKTDVAGSIGSMSRSTLRGEGLCASLRRDSSGHGRS